MMLMKMVLLMVLVLNMSNSLVAMDLALPVANKYRYEVPKSRKVVPFFNPYEAPREFLYNSSAYIKGMCRKESCNHNNCTGVTRYRSVLAGLVETININHAGMFDTVNGIKVITPMTHFFLEKQDDKTVDILIRLGLSPNVLNQNGQTILNQLVTYSVEAKTKDYNKVISLAEKALNLGVRINISDTYGNTPLHTIVTHPEDLTACMVGNFLLDNGAELDRKNNEGFTPLHIACLCNNKATVELLLARGAKIDAKTTDKQKNVLHLAIGEDIKNPGEALPLINALLKTQNVPINEGDYKGNTALHMAYSFRRSDLASLLIEHGADQQKENRAGNTPKHFFNRQR